MLNEIAVAVQTSHESRTETAENGVRMVERATGGMCEDVNETESELQKVPYSVCGI